MHSDVWLGYFACCDDNVFYFYGVQAVKIHR